MKVQVTLVPNEAKKLIAKAIAQMPLVQKTLKEGKILLKTGTTVSAVAEELVGRPMRILGRITPRGTVDLLNYLKGDGATRLLIDKGRVIIDDIYNVEIFQQMDKNDVVITGANALDIHGKAALLAGWPSGVPCEAQPRTGALISRIRGNGPTVVIAVGWDKLIPCSIEEASATAGKGIDLSMGYAMGLVSIDGIVVTETDALNMLADVKATVIASGGVSGAEGATTIVIEGKTDNVEKAWEAVQSVKGATLSGVPDSLIECKPGSDLCSDLTHRSCAYCHKNLPKKLFSQR